jgi:hypothetical protein
MLAKPERHDHIPKDGGLLLPELSIASEVLTLSIREYSLTSACRRVSMSSRKIIVIVSFRSTHGLKYSQKTGVVGLTEPPHITENLQYR